MKNYDDFIKSKYIKHQDSGFNIELSELNSSLFDFQKHIVQKALKKGRYAIFADCGLGKTFMQLEWANQVHKHTKKPVLILCPLAVAKQTIEEGKRFGIPIDVVALHKNNEISNYDQLKNIDCSIYSGVVLDESSILKNFSGKLKQLIIEQFHQTPYKLACTATPSPNDPMELGNHSEFLNVMKYHEMLAMYFVHDGGQTQKWRIKGHAEKDFYTWVGNWATMLNKPQDIGFEAEGYNLPDIHYIEHKIVTDKRDNGKLFNDTAVSATDFNKELRLTKQKRMQKAADIVNNSDKNFIIWIKQNEEGILLRKLIPDAVEVKGSDKTEDKESKLLGFAKNEFRVLITKTKIAQFGLNYQNCSNQIFASLDFSFEGLYQAIRRSYRFGQKNEVNIHIITTDTMQNVINTVKDKQEKFKAMQIAMCDTINKYSNQEIKPMKGKREKNEYYDIQNGDCVQLIKGLDDESIDFTVFSPPFAELYTYSDHIEDMGNSKDYKEFLEQFNYLVKELHRVTLSGRLVAIHCMDLPIQKGKEGYIGLRSFSNMIIEQFLLNNFILHSEVIIWKNPVTEMQRTKALGLLHKQLKKDSTMTRVGIPDKVLVFRKRGKNPKPVNTNISVDLWQKWASPIWMDINYSNTLNFRGGRDQKDEKHICPLQLDTIERLIELYSNKGDKVFTPFMGIGSEVYQAVKMERIGLGFELKESYFNLAKKNINIAVGERQQLTLF